MFFFLLSKIIMHKIHKNKMYCLLVRIKIRVFLRNVLPFTV